MPGIADLPDDLATIDWNAIDSVFLPYCNVLSVCFVIVRILTFGNPHRYRRDAKAVYQIP